MPASVKKIGQMYRVVGPDGKPEVNNSGTPVDGGGHKSKDAAIEQMQAINISKQKSKSALATPLQILSDGTPEGTLIIYNGQLIDAERLSMHCSKDKFGPYCEIEICMKDRMLDGMEVYKTVRLKKDLGGY